MSNDVDLSIRQFTEAWRLMCSAAPQPAILAGESMHFIFSGCPIAFFNVAVVTGRSISSDGMKSHAEQACSWSSDKGVPWLFIVTHEALEPEVDPVAVLDGCGLAPVMSLTGMIADRVPPAAKIADGLQLTVPQDDDACSALLDVNGLAYGMDLEAGKELMGKRAFWEDHLPVLGMADGRPACCAAVMMVDGYRYVALVATDPAYQRRGFADAAMRRALELSADVHGERPTVLHATEAGRPIYERMGYTAISTHTLFMQKAFLAGH